jgi:hypothetical protein
MQKTKSTIFLALLCLYFIKVLVRSSGYEDAVILLVLGSIVSFFEFKTSDSKLVAIEKQLAKLTEDIEIKNKDVDAVKSAMASMKMAQGMRGIGNVR